MARARNSGESSNRRMKAFACFSTLAGTISAVRSSPNRKIGSRSLRRRLAASTSSRICHCVGVASAPSTETSQHDSLLKTSTSRRASVVAEAGDDAKSLLLDGGGELPHAAPGGAACLRSPRR